MPEKLSLQEEEALLVIFRSGEGTVKQFLEQMPDPPPYTTLASTIKNLERKGYIRSRMVGNTYMYRATQSEQEYKRQFMSGVVKKYFDNSYKDLVNFFIQQQKVSPQELKEIISMIERGDQR